MRIADQRIFLFDRGKAIFPSRPRLGCAAVSSGGQGWAPLGGHPKGLSLTAASTGAGFFSAGTSHQKTCFRPPQKTGSCSAWLPFQNVTSRNPALGGPAKRR